MLTSVRSLIAVTFLAGTALAATPAMAQDEEETPAVTVTGNVTLVTDYRFRGVGLSDGDPAVQGSLTLNTAPGFYAGVWGSSLGYTPQYGEIEIDLYAGWAGNITDGVGADVGVTYYTYPSSDALAPEGDILEFYGKIKPSVGPVGLTLGVAYAPNQDSLASDNLYLSLDAGAGIPSTPISLSAHVGYTDGSLAFTTDGTAWDWSVGGSVTVLGGLTLGVSYIGVEHDGFDTPGIYDDTVVGTIGYSF